MTAYNFFKDNKPDGFKAFTIAILVCIMQAIVMGISNSFPTFISYIVDDEHFKNDKPSSTSIALASSLSLGLNPLIGLVSGYFLIYTGSRLSSIFCIICCAISLIIPAVAANKNYRVITAVYGLFMAVSIGIVLNVPFCAVSTWFLKRKTLGMAIVSASGGIGSAIFPTISGQLIEKMDWRKTFLCLSTSCIVGLLCSFFVTMRSEESDNNNIIIENEGIFDNDKDKKEEKPNNNEQQAKPKGEERELIINTNEIENESQKIQNERNINVDRATLKEWIFNVIFTKSFLSLFFSFVFFSFGYTGFFFINVPYPSNYLGKNGTIYADDEPISVQAASNLYIYFGIAQVIGAPVCGFLALKLTDRYVYSALMLSLSIAMFCYIPARKYFHFVLINIVMGWGGGTIYGVFASMVAKRFYGPNLGLSMALAFISSVPGGFIPPALCSAMLDKYNNYTNFIIISGITFFISALIVFIFIEDRIGQPVIGEGNRQLILLKKKNTIVGFNDVKNDNNVIVIDPNNVEDDITKNVKEE